MNVVANKLSSVGDDSFKNSRWLREQINSSLGIISLGNVVLGYNPGYNKNVDISYEDLKDYTCVANGAFNGLDSLKISIPRNIKTIASVAFNDIGGLEIFVQNTYNNISSIANNVDNLEINVLRELDDFYKNRISTYNLFEGNIGNSSYKISELNDFDNSLILFILDQDYREYSDNEIKINEIVFRDKSTLLPAYKVKDLYLDSDYQIKYTDSTIRLDNNQCFYIKMEPIRYTVFIDYDNGDDGDESEKSIIFYNYNEIVRFNLASKPYCQPLSRFRLNGEIVYANNATKIENLFDAECDCFNPVVELTAIWDYEVYTITYHEKDINDKEKQYTQTYTYFEVLELYPAMFEDGRVFLGWYDESLKIKYDDRSINKYSDNLDLYSKYGIYKYHKIEKEYKITDSGRFNQKYDTLKLNEILGYSIDELKELQYNKIKITIVLSMKEIDEGYQYVFLYDGPNKNSNLLAESDKICVSNTEYNSIEVVFELNLSEITDIVYIRFGASGNFNDDWKTNYREYKIIVMGE